jgi:ketosteroid isomerase-like protein
MEGDAVVHPNAQTVVGAFQAFADDDMDTLAGLFTDDAVWHVAGRNRWSGDYVGSDAIVQYMIGIVAEATIHNDLHALLADDDHVVVLVASSSSRSGKRIESNAAFVFHVGDGKIAEAWALPVDQYLQDEFWAD